MKKNDFLISIIIPYHGNNAQVQNLLDTIPDNNAIEVLLINDIYDAKPLQYSRFTATKIIELHNAPPVKWAGASRNTGLRHCTGKFIIFADSDDTLITNNFLILLDKLKTIDTFDYAVCPVTSIITDTKQTGTRHLAYEEMVTKFVSNGDKIALIKQHIPWSKVFSHDFLRRNNITFEEVEASNDVVFSLKCWIQSQKIIFIDVLFYKVTESKSSLTQVTTKQRAKSRFREFVKYNDILQDTNYQKYKYNLDWFLKEINKYSYLYNTYGSFVCIYKGHPFSNSISSDASRKKQILFVLKDISKKTKTYWLFKPIVNIMKGF